MSIMHNKSDETWWKAEDERHCLLSCCSMNRRWSFCAITVYLYFSNSDQIPNSISKWKCSPTPARNLHHSALLPEDTHPCCCSALWKLTALWQSQIFLISSEHLLPFFCMPVLVFLFISESLGFLFHIWGMTLWLQVFHKDHFQADLPTLWTVIPASHWFLLALGGWCCWTSSDSKMCLSSAELLANYY